MVSSKLPWFPCYPSKLLGAFAAMPPHEGYVYWIVCLRIYEVDGPCRDSDEAISRRTGLPKGKVADALARLFESGKLVRTEAGITNPDKVRRRAGASRRTPSNWRELRADVFVRDRFQCRYCGSTEALECDHFVAKSKGGSDSINNLVTACRSCNRKKGSRMPGDWSMRPRKVRR